MKPKYFFSAWLITFVALFLLNGLFHGLVAASFFDAHLSGLGTAVVKMKDFHPLPIVLLELMLDGCLTFLVTRARNERVLRSDAVLIGGLFYLSTAMSWNLANSATFVTWPVIVILVDGAWHFMTGLLAGWIIYKLYNRQFLTSAGQ